MIINRHVIRTKKLNNNMFEVIIERNKTPFESGDKLGIYDNNNTLINCYIASGMQEAWFRFLLPDDQSLFSNYILQQPKKGIVRTDSIEHTHMFGSLQQKIPTIFVAQDLKLAPFLSYLSTYYTWKPYKVIHCAKEPINQEWFKYQKIDYTCVETIEDTLALIPFEKHMQYYVCANSSLINNVKQLIPEDNYMFKAYE